MRTRTRIAVILGLLCAPVAHPSPAGAPTPYVYPFNAMTGEQVVARLLKAPVTDLEYIERDMTHSYVNGVKDATQGAIWCFTGVILPHELDIELAGAIKSAHTPAERKGNAAPLLLDELRRRYPCGAAKGRKP